MILTCPQCAMRFVLPDSSLGERGRNVKCSSCGEIWFQEPNHEEGDETGGISEEIVAEEVVEEASTEIDPPAEDESESKPAIEEDIPDAIKPGPEEGEEDSSDETSGETGEGASAESGEESKEDEKPLILMGPVSLTQKETFSYGAALLLFISTFALLLVSHEALMRSWPASRAFFSVFGFHAPMPGEGLVFDRLQVDVKQGPDNAHLLFTVEGQIVNLSSENVEIPLIEAQLRNENHEILARWLIEAPEKLLQAESVQSFSAKHSLPVIEGITDLRLVFVLKGTPGHVDSDDQGHGGHEKAMQNHDGHKGQHHESSSHGDEHH